MIRLRSLGGLGLDLDGAQAPIANVRPRILALLALLVGHGPTGLSRDKVLGFLWPDSDTSHARNSLKQALFSLRQTLGHSAVSSTSGSLRLDPNCIEVDLWQFEAALEHGDHGGAVALYQGPFLDGFYAGALPEFERWVEVERQRLGRRYIDALRGLAREADQRGGLDAAVMWWRRLADADPLSSSAAVGLMRALAASGDPAAALEHAREHGATVRQELDLPVEEPVSALVRRLRDEAARKGGPGVDFTAASPGKGQSDGHRPDARPIVGVQAGHAGAAFSPAALTVLPRVRGLDRLRWAAYAGPLVLALAVAVALGPGRWGQRRGVSQASTLVVLPFMAPGDSAAADLGAALGHLVAAGLDGLEAIRSVPLAVPPDGSTPAPTRRAAAALAARSGARLYVTGMLVHSGGRLRAIATLRDRGNADQQVGQAVAEAEDGSLLDLADELVAGLVASRYGLPDQRLARAAAGGTRSLVALKAHLEGERLLRDDQYGSSLDAFRRAVRADTAFALGYYRLSVAADLGGRADEALWAAGLAARFGDRLPEHERRLVEAYLVHRRGRAEEAERRYRRIIADAPGDAEAWFQLTEILFHLNPLRGRSVREAEPVIERLLALDPGNREALLHLAQIVSLRGDAAGADSLVRKAGGGADPVGIDVRAFRGFVSSDPRTADLAVRELVVGTGAAASRLKAALGIAVQPRDLDAAERFARSLIVDPGSCEVRALGRRVLAQTALAGGRRRSADRWLAQTEGCDRPASLELRIVYHTLPFLPLDQGALRSLADDLRAFVAEPGRSRREELIGRYGLGLVGLVLGDSIRARSQADGLVAASDSADGASLAWALAQSLRGRMALHRGRAERALAFLERAHWGQVRMPPVVEVDDRYLRAELLARLGRREEAAGWYASIAERSLYETVYLGPALHRRGQLFERQGDREAALACYELFVQLWTEAEEPYPAFLQQATRRIAELRGGAHDLRPRIRSAPQGGRGPSCNESDSHS